MAAIRDLVEVDDDGEELRRLDRARVLIRTPWRPILQHTFDIHMAGRSTKFTSSKKTGTTPESVFAIFRAPFGRRMKSIQTTATPAPCCQRWLEHLELSTCPEVSPATASADSRTRTTRRYPMDHETRKIQ